MPRLLLHPNQGVGGGGAGGGGLGGGQAPRVDDEAPIPVASPAPQARPDAGSSKIRPMAQGLLGGTRHEDTWDRSPNVTGTGAIHVKSFHCKLTGESLEYLDRQINEWLDDHPQYEVKFVTTAIGEWTGKLKEPNLIVQVWV